MFNLDSRKPPFLIPSFFLLGERCSTGHIFGVPNYRVSHYLHSRGYTHCNSSGRQKRGARYYGSMGLPEYSQNPVIEVYLEALWSGTGRLSAVKATGTEQHDDGPDENRIAGSRRKGWHPGLQHQIKPRYGE